MKISTLIRRLQVIEHHRGDIDVTIMTEFYGLLDPDLKEQWMQERAVESFSYNLDGACVISGMYSGDMKKHWDELDKQFEGAIS